MDDVIKIAVTALVTALVIGQGARFIGDPVAKSSQVEKLEQKVDALVLLCSRIPAESPTTQTQIMGATFDKKPLPEIATTAQIADYYGKHPDTIRRWISEGRINATKKSKGVYLVRKSSPSVSPAFSTP